MRKHGSRASRVRSDIEDLVKSSMSRAKNPMPSFSEVSLEWMTDDELHHTTANCRCMLQIWEDSV